MVTCAAPDEDPECVGRQCSGVGGFRNGPFPHLLDGQLDDGITKGRHEGRRKGRAMAGRMDRGQRKEERT